MKRLVMAAFAASMVLGMASAHASTCDNRMPIDLCNPGGAGGSASMIDNNGNVAVYHAMVSSAAFAAGVPEHIAHAVVRNESGYRANARSRAGALGLMQIKCQTARGIGFGGSCHELLEPSVNLTWGMKYLRMAIDKGGAGCSGVTLYNTGIAARPHCSGYGRKVQRLALAVPSLRRYQP
jgi:soluble lytic murein transglycosylase-like protein